MSLPSDCTTLAAALERAASLCARGVTAVRARGGEERWSYEELHARAVRLLGDLQGRGLRPGDHVVIQAGETLAFLRSFWACVLGGFVPVPLAESRGPEQWLKFTRVCAQLRRPHLLTTAAALELAVTAARASGAEAPRDSVTLVDAAAGSRDGRPALVQPDDIAFVQFSSGSTGHPKGVVLAHRNLLTNIRAMRRRTRTETTDETLVSWMPLTHDMGLIGFHITPVVAGWDHVLVPPESFQRHPLAWLELVARHRATVTGSPNYGLRHTLKHAVRNASTLDLSSLRMLLNGAEPISHEVCREFVRALGSQGLRADAMLPVYGLAEASLAVTFPDPGEPLRCVSVERGRLAEGDRVVLLGQGDPRARTFVAVGAPVDDCAVRIALEDGSGVEEGTVGRIQIRGDNVASAFYGREEGGRREPGDWLDTGDLGFVHEGRLVVTGRRKEILFLNGQNVYPADVERVIAEAIGMDEERVAVSGSAAGEVFEAAAFITHRGDLSDFAPLAAAARRDVGERLGLPLRHVVPVPRIPRTTSGKPQRVRLGEELEAGAYDDVLRALASLRPSGGAGLQPGESSRGAGLQPGESNGGAGLQPCESAVGGHTAIARTLEIWRGVLDAPALAPTDHFFEHGGDSLKAARVAALVGRAFGRDVPARLVFEQPTAARFAAAVESCPPLAGAIGAAEARDVYPVSPEQQTLLLLQKATPDSTAYNVPFAVRIHGAVDAERLERALADVGRRHDALRTRFVTVNGVPMQRVERDASLRLAVEAIEPERLDEALAAFVRPFDPEAGPLVRAALFRLGAHEHVLACDVHHAVADGGSAILLLADVAASYNGHLRARPARSPLDYAVHRHRAARETDARDEAYWLEKFADGIPPLDLPAEGPRQHARRFAGSRVRFILDERETAAVRQVAAQCGTTVFAVLLSAYYVLLARLAGQRDVAVASVAAGRPDEAAWETVGMFVRTALLRAQVEGAFDDLLRRVTTIAAEAFSHAGVPIEQWAARLPEPARRRGPLVDAMFVLQNMTLPSIDFGGAAVTPVAYPIATAKFDLCLEVWDAGSSLSCVLEYADGVLGERSARRCASWYRRLLSCAAASPGAHVDALDVLDADERREIVELFNDTAAPVPDATVLDLFERQARRTPGEPAVIVASTGATESYAGLNARAAGIARRLRSAGVARGETVGVLLPRSVELVASVLAVWKCGAAYVPLEPDVPAERLAHYVADSAARLVIGAGEAASALRARADVPIVAPEPDTSAAAGGLPPAPRPSDLAYVIYTSGTTGTPKGVMIEHRSLVNYVTWAVRAYQGGDRANHAFHTSFAFDLTVTSMFAPLVSGGAVVVYAGEAAAGLRAALTDARVDVVKLTPSHLKLARALGIRPSPRRLIVGGESLETDVARALADDCPGVEIYNEYGPTEATVGCMIHRFDPLRDIGAAVPIGVPAANCRIYVLDASRRPVPPLAAGEIHIGGDCLARGYRGDPSLTDARFVPDPFAPGGRMYATGDLARRGAAGVLEFLGRADEQVKIRGHRVSPEEVRAHLVAFPGVRDAFVAAEFDASTPQESPRDETDPMWRRASALRESPDETDPMWRRASALRSASGRDVELHAYLVTDAPVRAAELRTFVAGRLPAFMVPAVFRVVPELPLTPNGKLDRRALAASSKALEPAGGYEPPQTAVEEQLAAAWCAVLGAGRVGRHDNFFDLGGDSIKAMLVAARAERLGLAFTMQDVLAAQTVAALAARCRGADPAVPAAAPERGSRRLLPMEAWFVEQRFAAPERYVHAVLLRLRGRAEVDRLRDALRAVIAHHEGLRQNLDETGGEIRLDERHAGADAGLDVIGVDGECDASAAAAMAETIAATMDLREALLFRAALLRTPRADLLLFVAHHLVVDGVSWRIVIEDLATAYAAPGVERAAALPRRTASPRAVAEGLEAYGRSARVQAQVPYWRSMCEGAAAPPTGRCDAMLDRQRFSLDVETTRALTRGARAGYNTDPGTLLVVALLRVLRARSGHPTHLLELEHHGRSVPGVAVSRTVGWLASLYPLLLELPDETLDAQIKSVKEQLRRVPDAGRGYGVLRYVTREPSLQAPVRAAARLNYLGELTPPNDGLVAEAEELFMDAVPHAAPPSCDLQIDALVRSGRLRVVASGRHPVRPFVEAYGAELQRVAEHAGAQDRIQFTPSDFDTVVLGQRELDRMLT